MIRAICSMMAIISVVSSQVTLQASPCPDVFTYEPPVADDTSGAKKWYGVVNLNTDITLHALWLNIILDGKADILGNWLGEVTTEDNFNFKIENTKQKVVPGQSLAVRFFVQYTQKKAPRVESILFNGREICNTDISKTVVVNPVQTDNNYGINSGITEKTDRTTTTTVRTTTVVSTKYAYSKSQSNSQDSQTTTLKPSYWTKVPAIQTTTDKSKLETKSENKGQVASGIRNQQTKNQTQIAPTNISQLRQQNPTSQLKPQATNYQTTAVKKANITESKSQVTFGSTSSLKPQSWPEVKLETGQVATANKHTVVAEDNTKYQPWTGTNFENNEQTQSDNKQLHPSRVVSFGTATGNTNNKADIWNPKKTENNQASQPKPVAETRPIEKPQISTVNSQYYSQPNVDNYHQTPDEDGPENRFQDSSYVEPQDTHQRKQGSDSESRRQPVRVITASFQVSTDRPSVSTGTINVATPQSWSDERAVVKPINSKEDVISTSSGSQSWSAEKPKITYGSTETRYNNNDGIRDEINYNEPSSYGFDLDRLAPNVPVVATPVIEYLDDTNPKEEEDEFFNGGLPVFIPNSSPEPTCGKVIKKPPRVLPYGSSTSEGQWPWQTALYQQRSVNFKYICGGTLVSDRHVLTAAHCVTKRKNAQVVNKNTLTVYLGKFNLRTSVDGVQVKFVNRIIVHPDYNATTYSRNLAILVLRDSASFTDWVRPACLWPEDEINLSSIVGKKGSVVGWGFDSSGAPKAELNLLEMPVVAQDTCISSYNIYERFTSAHTYCARYKDDTETCNGDSGGGMVFKKGNTWYLRGLVSIAVTTQNEYLCDPKHYIIFTDIAKFLPWIFDQLDS